MTDPTAGVDPLSPFASARPLWLTDLSAWHNHVPFAFSVVELARPRTLVELGTHGGDSYCAFCQAVSRHGLDTRCVAIDSWAGDVHLGEYEVDVLERLREHHDPLYGRFSELRQTTFDEAVSSFDDGSIDLLHIDGTHTYDAVSHDFATWLPKLSERAVVLLHDTQERSPGFGVWRLWEEVRDRYPSFEFLHGHGLGLLAVGADAPPGVATFLAAADARPDEVRDLFAALGERVSLICETDRLRATVEEQAAALERLAAEERGSEARAAQAQADLATVLGSASWRLTALPRRLSGRVRGR